MIRDFILTYKHTFLSLVILQICFLSPILTQNVVIFPHSNSLEATGYEAKDVSANRKFSDISNSFIPEINLHLNGNQNNWLSTWNPRVQFGRPAFQRWQSKASLITHLLSLFTNNPFVLYSMLASLIVSLTGIFCFLFLKALELHPLACFSIAAGLSMGPYFSYWLTFVQFLAVQCWTLGLLWLIIEFIKKRSFVTGAGLAFFTYNLLMMGRIQTIIRSAYLIVGFTLIYLWLANRNFKWKVYTLGFLGMAALFGAITALPTYLDLIANSARSARISNVDDSFFLTNLPRIENLRELGLFMQLMVDPFWFGNPIKSDYPFIYNGFSFTPLYFFLFLMSFTNYQWRRLWPWQLLAAAGLIATLWSPAYLFIVHYLGFHLSRSTPLGVIFIPVHILAGYALDHLLRNGTKQILSPIILIALPLAGAGFTGFSYNQDLRPVFVLISLLIIVSVGLFLWTKSHILLIILTTIAVFVYGFSMMLSRPLDTIRISSPLVEKIKQETQDGSRYAWVGSPRGVLPPNQEALLGIRSIHSYDSVSSVNFQKLVLRLSDEGTKIYGRHFNNLSSAAKLDHDPFSYTGVSLILSRQQLNQPLLQEVGEINGIKFYKLPSAPILEAQLTDFERQADNQVHVAGSLVHQTRLDLDKLASFDDFLRFKVTPVDQETLLFVSQQYHPFWQATGNGKPLSTVMINDFYLGAIIPPQVTEVTLEFRPYARFSWIPQLIYGVSGVMILGMLIKPAKSKLLTANFRAYF